MNLNSQIFDKVRIPSRSSLARLIDRICFENDTTPQAVRSNRYENPSDRALLVRREILIAARAAGYAPGSIGDWFNHKDSSTVVRWLADMDELA